MLTTYRSIYLSMILTLIPASFTKAGTCQVSPHEPNAPTLRAYLCLNGQVACCDREGQGDSCKISRNDPDALTLRAYLCLNGQIACCDRYE